MERRVLIIGIDSLSPELIDLFKDDLPNFNELRQNCPNIRLKSIFPPDSIPAWISIYTGLSPARHGIVHTFDVFESDWKSIANLDVTRFKGRTFWDIASKHGKKVCILFPLAAFPPWEVNGIMISRSIYPPEDLKKKGIHVENNGVLAYPQELNDKYDISHLHTLSGEHPSFKNLKNYAEKAKKKIIDQAKFGLRISKEYDWDLFFIYFSELDIIQHFFWRYFDERDPTHRPNNPYKNVIKDFYKLFDQIIGEFFKIHPDTIKMVISDHGHGMRPLKVVNLNEYLRLKGYLKVRKIGIKGVIQEGIKKIILDLAHKMDMMYLLVKIGKSRFLSKTSKKTYTSSSLIDYSESLAYLAHFPGVKSYSEGGIIVNKDVLGDKYETFRDILIKELLQLRNPETGERLFEWVKRREDIYNGEFIENYPDIVFKLKESYGVYWSVYTPLIGTSYEHTLSSGGHKENAVFLISDVDTSVMKTELTLMDIAPTILHLLNIDWRRFDFDGKSIFK